MNEQFDQALAVSILAEAWRSGTMLAELPATARRRTLAEGYDIQDRLIEALDQPVAGWKLGVGSTLHGDDVTEPVVALADLVSIARERDITLSKGSIISTGTVSNPFNIAAATAEISARFLGRGVRISDFGEPD
jgi:2-keto-4-pentenoate hydratase